MKWVPLHHHSTFSFMDGYRQPWDHVERAAELGYSAQTLTEHGNVSSHVPLEKAGKHFDVKPIFGMEAYTGPSNMRETGNTRKWHLTLLAMNDVGYQNLMRLATRSWAEGFYRWPTVTGPMLAEHNEGLIVLSGCADSKVACDLLGGKGAETGSARRALRTIEKFKALLGDRYYLECQMFPELERSRAINSWYAEASKRCGVPLVGTADSHYPHPDDNEMQVILHAAGRGAGTVDAQEASWEYDIRLSPPVSDSVVLERLQGTGLSRYLSRAALLNTAEIADRCNVVLPKSDRLRFPLPDGITDSKTLIWNWIRDGWRYRSRFNPLLRTQRAEYTKRLYYEMELIEEKDFFDYFLMLSEAVRWMKDRGRPVGPARGSAAASLVCYLLRITEVDPLQFPMMFFERFIAHDRTDVPDVDLDFSDESRHELHEHMVDVYGPERVGFIMTATKYKGKNSLIDVARVNRVPDYEIKTIKDLMIERSSGDARSGATLMDTIEMFPQARAVMDKYPVLWKALRLEGNYRGMSVHSAGMVVANRPLNESVATYQRTTGTGGKKSTRAVVSVDKYDAEYLGLMKADFLGLTTLGMIQRALKLVGLTLEDMYDVKLDDPKILQRFRDGDVTGVFQFGGGATRIVNNDVAPETFMELADINALSRPGPLHSGSTQDYIDIKHGRKRRPKLRPIMERLVGWTQGQIIYQEQILAIVREIGGFDWTHAQEIRKIISQKHGNAAFNMREGIFIEGAKRLHGMEKDEAHDIWIRLATAGTYAFNVAHSVSYSMLAYWTMWLKVYHPVAFYTACLLKYTDVDDQYFMMRDAIKHEITVSPPSLERSGPTWEMRGKTIRAGFAQLPGVGEALGAEIIRDRAEYGAFRSWHELERVKGIGPKKLEQLLAAAETDDPFGIHKVDRLLGKVRASITAGELPLPVPSHRADEIPTDGRKRRIVFVGLPTLRDSRDVIEDERGQTGEDYDTIRARMKRPDLVKRMVVHALDESDATVYLRWNRFTFPQFEDALWRMRLDHDVILVRGEKRPGFGTSIYVEDAWIINPDDD